MFCLFCCAVSSSTMASAVLGAMPAAIPVLSIGSAHRIHRAWDAAAAKCCCNYSFSSSVIPRRIGMDVAFSIISALSLQRVGYTSAYWGGNSHNSQDVVGEDPTVGICRHGRAVAIFQHRRRVSVQPTSPFYAVSRVRCSSLEAKAHLVYSSYYFQAPFSSLGSARTHADHYKSKPVI